MQMLILPSITLLHMCSAETSPEVRHVQYLPGLFAFNEVWLPCFTQLQCLCLFLLLLPHPVQPTISLGMVLMTTSHHNPGGLHLRKRCYW
jgi:hypothetical protein